MLKLDDTIENLKDTKLDNRYFQGIRAGEIRDSFIKKYKIRLKQLKRKIENYDKT